MFPPRLHTCFAQTNADLVPNRCAACATIASCIAPHSRSTSEISDVPTHARVKLGVVRRKTSAHKPVSRLQRATTRLGLQKGHQMKTLLGIPLLLVLAVSSTAFAQDVRYNFDKQANFGSFRTYRWVSIKGTTPASDLTDRQIKAAVDAELAKKGLTQVQGSGDADLFIGYQAAIDTEKSFTSYDTGWGYGPGWGGGGWYGGGGGMTTGQTSTIYVGQLALDMYSPSPKALVWRGVASKTLDAKAKPEKQEKNLAKAVTKLLKNYPPQLKS